MAEESQNALLKTLEEPPGLRAHPPDHLRARRPARDGPKPPRRGQVRGAAAGGGRAPPGRRAAERGAGGAAGAGGAGGGRPRPRARPRLPLGPAAARPRRGLRARRPSAASSPRAPGRTCSRSPPSGASIEGGAGRRGRRRAGRRARQGPRRRPDPARGRRGARSEPSAAPGPRRSTWRSGWSRRWFTDVVAVAEGAPELARNADRAEQLAADARDADPVACRRAAELAMETRRRLHGQRQRGAGAGRSVPPRRSTAWATSLRCSKTDAAMSAEVPGPPMTKPPELPELPVTADRPAIQPTAGPARLRRAALARPDVRRRSGS